MRSRYGIRPHSNKKGLISPLDRNPFRGTIAPGRMALAVLSLVALFAISVFVGARLGMWSASKVSYASDTGENAALSLDNFDPEELEAAGDSIFGADLSLASFYGDSPAGFLPNSSLLSSLNYTGDLKRYTYTISENDSFYNSLQCFGVPHDLIMNWFDLAKGEYNLEKLRPGQTFCLWATPDNDFVKFEFNIDSREQLIIDKEEEGYRARRETREEALAAVGGVDNVPLPAWVDPETGLHYYRGVVKSNFYTAATNAGMTDSKVMNLVRVFGGINFGTLEQGAIFSVVVGPGEKPDEEGMILAAMIEKNKKPSFIFRFEQDGKAAYFDESGKSSRGSSLVCPVKYTRISSYYSYRRFHPILKRYRPHLGVDYAAPVGTPIRAAANGRVLYAKWRSGFGYTIRIRHDKTYESQYAHLSRFARGIGSGKYVRQGQVIGYVGSTGRSTGPHLDYRIYKYGKPINPLRVTGMPGPPVKNKEEFAEQKKVLMAELERDLPYGPPLAWPRTENRTRVAQVSDN